MSQRSYNSLAHDKRIANHRVTDDDLFECVHYFRHCNIFWVIRFYSYVLRVAWDALSWYRRIFIDKLCHSLLSYLMLPKVNDSPKADIREHSSRLSALSNFSIGDMFRDVRDGSKSTKFPEKLLKVLEQKLQDIAMGKDAASVDHLFLPQVNQTNTRLLQILWSTRSTHHGQVLWPVHDR